MPRGEKVSAGRPLNKRLQPSNVFFSTDVANTSEAKWNKAVNLAMPIGSVASPSLRRNLFPVNGV